MKELNSAETLFMKELANVMKAFNVKYECRTFPNPSEGNSEERRVFVGGKTTDCRHEIFIPIRDAFE